MLFRNKKQTNIKNLKEAEKRILEGQERLERLAQELERFQEAMGKALTKVGTVRYSAFSEVGGDQSFSVALLNGKKDGVVFTSHYGRDSNRVYAKPVSGGRSEYALSQEEEEAIRKALAEEEIYERAQHSSSRKAARSRT